MIDTATFFLYLAFVSGSTYLIRALPFGLATKKMENRFVASFLYYIPYAVLTAMTFPAVFFATSSVLSAALGTAVAIILAIWVNNLTLVACSACVVAFITELIVGLSA